MRNPLEPIIMKKTEMGSHQPHLPQEIITRIIKGLPVKSLIRFQCVCKRWKNLIKNPSFIADHFQQPHLQNPSLLFECNRSDDSLVLWNLRLMDSGKPVRQIQKPPLIDTFNGASIVGSCNGLLCVEIKQYYKSPSLSLWNPSTAAVRHFPRSKNGSFFDYCVTGFGFSLILNDYKIVRIYDQFIDSAEVFSLTKGSWKEIDIRNLRKDILKLERETVTTNGAIFWTGTKVGSVKEDGDNIEVEEDEEEEESEHEDEVKLIVSFDIAKEVFTLMRLPDLDYGNANELKLTIFENKLAILFDIWVDDERCDLIDLWVMEEGTCAFGERRSWTKIYTSSPCSYTLSPMTVWRNEIVCKVYTSEDDDGERTNIIYLMNVTTNEVKSLVIPHHANVHSMYNYVESLVLVDNVQLLD